MPVVFDKGVLLSPCMSWPNVRSSGRRRSVHRRKVWKVLFAAVPLNGRHGVDFGHSPDRQRMTTVGWTAAVRPKERRRLAPMHEPASREDARGEVGAFERSSESYSGLWSALEHGGSPFSSRRRPSDHPASFTTHQPAARTDARRHGYARPTGRDAARLYPVHAELRRVPTAATGHGDGPGPGSINDLMRPGPDERTISLQANSVSHLEEHAYLPYCDQITRIQIGCRYQLCTRQ
jgi:hypothetical protein